MGVLLAGTRLQLLCSNEPDNRVLLQSIVRKSTMKAEVLMYIEPGLGYVEGRAPLARSAIRTYAESRDEGPSGSRSPGICVAVEADIAFDGVCVQEIGAQFAQRRTEAWQFPTFLPEDVTNRSRKRKSK